MAHQKRRFTGFLDFCRCKVGQLLHHVRPVVGNGVVGVMPKLVYRLDFEAPAAQVFEEDAVGAGSKTVGVGKDDQRHQISFSCGVPIFLSGLLRSGFTISGTSVWPPSQVGSSMLSNTSRSFLPQLLCIIWKYGFS